MKILVINGPNLNLLGIRDPDIYGRQTYTDLCELCKKAGEQRNVEIEIFQSNHEGAIVDRIGEAYGNVDGIVINPAAYTHTSIAILDALKAVSVRAIEVHITDPDAREDFRKTNYLRLACEKTVSGHGPAGYLEAMDYLAEKAGGPSCAP